MTNKPTSDIFNFSGKVQFKAPHLSRTSITLDNSNSNTLGSHLLVPEESLPNDIKTGTQVSGTVKVTYGGDGMFDDDTIEVQTVDIVNTHLKLTHYVR